MPLIEFKCKKCKKTFEEIRVIARMDEDGYCPKCGRSGDRVEFSQTSPMIRGGGGWSSPASKR